MFLIFGVQGIKRRVEGEEVLENCCPSCGSGDLIPTSFRNWFTLFFIPIFPVSSGRLIYRCDQCKNSFDAQIKDHLKRAVFQSTVEQDVAPLVYSRGLIASLVYLVGLDSGRTSKQMYEIDKLIFKYPNYAKELESIKTSVLNSGNAENQVFEYLYEAKDLLNKTELWDLFIEIGSFMRSMNSITTNQESLIKEYLIACGFPKSKFGELIKN